MNAQANLLQRNGILGTTISEVDKFLTRNRGHKYSSNEIFLNMPVWLQTQIQSVASAYTKGACSSPASYVGVAASMLSKRKISFVHDYSGYCTILGRTEDTFMHM